MNPLAVVLLIGPLIAFVTAVNFALLNGGDWSLPEIAGVLMLAVVIDATFARIALAAAGSGLPF
jgi:hypothetical protein